MTPPRPEILGGHRVVPVVVLQDVRQAAPSADALVAGGLPVAEVTFRTAAAEAALRRMAADGRLLVGAGTVLGPAQVERAVEAGARFVVSRGFSLPVVRRAQQLGVPVYPGVATPSEIMAALDAGLDVLKLFPAKAFGGAATLKALAAPFPGVRFVPTGGVSAESMTDYLQHPAVVAVGGSWMVAPSLLQAGDYAAVTALSARAAHAAAYAGAAASRRPSSTAPRTGPWR
jgi:2-dehydro-3-deoxyphosphogluconate aldolase/(4S)-4-hydroxy-2-oxoglutarate aldolase